MNEYDIKLNQIEQKQARRKELCQQRSEAQEASDAIKDNAEQLESVYNLLHQDAERLASGRQSARKQAALEEAQRKEREAYARYLPVKKEREALQNRIAAAEQELESLSSIDSDYEKALREKQNYLQNSGGEAAEQILRMEREKEALTQQKADMADTLRLGQEALTTAEDLFGTVVVSSSSARVDAYKDITGGIWHKATTGENPESFFITNLLMAAEKFGTAAAAKKKLPRLREQIMAYTENLSDVEIYMDDIDLHINGILALADVLGDKLLAPDMLVASKMRDNVEKVRRVVNQIVDTQKNLNEKICSIEGHISQMQCELNDFVRHRGCEC